jgi:DNA-directed RNA polymerase subunit F
MEKEKLNNQYEPSNYSFTMVPDYFFRKLIKVMGTIPSLVYLTLLSYCHKKKYIAWPSLNTMSQEMGMAKTTIIRNLNILIKLNFIKNIAKDKSSKNYYHHNVYQILPPEKILLSIFSDAKNNAGVGSVSLPLEFQNATDSGSETIPWVVAECYPNHNNLNHNNITTKEGKDVVVDFKKLKEKGDLSTSTCAYPHADRCNAQAEEKMQAIREQLIDLDFKESLIEKLLKEYSPKKIEKKLDLLLNRRNIQNPAGWLSAALKNDYQDPEQERYAEEPAGPVSHLSRMDSHFRENDIKRRENDIKRCGNDIKRCGNDREDDGNDPGKARLYRASIEGSGNNDKKFLSREELIRRFHLLGQKLKEMNYSQSKP